MACRIALLSFSIWAVGFQPAFRPAILSAGEGPPSSPDLAEKVDALFSQWNKPESPGCAVGIVRDGRLIYKKGYGSANLDYQVLNTPRTIFETGSFAKSVTCMCVALLMDQGKISPDDDVRRFVGELHEFDPPVRVRHLITCHSGVWAQFHIMPLAGWENIPIHAAYVEDDVLAVLSGQKKLPFEPGARFQYGSGDYFLLGLIVQRVSGQSLADFARQKIFQPLGMNDTFYEQHPWRVVKRRAVGHYKETDGAWRQWTNHGYLPGGSGLKSSVEDLYRWDQNFCQNRLPSGKYVDELIREGTLLGNRYVLDADAFLQKLNPAYPIPAGHYRGLKRMQFTGGVFGMAACMARFPTQRFSVICLANNEDVKTRKMAANIADLYLAHKLQPKTKAKPRQVVKPPAVELKNKVGVFQAEDGVIFNVSFKDGKLWNSNARGETYELKPFSATKFQPAAYPEDTFVFTRPAANEPYTLSLEWHGGTIPFRRVKLADPAALELGDYIGEFFSDELFAAYRFRVKDKSLWLRVNSRRWEKFKPTVADEFVPVKRFGHENRRIKFRRDDKQRVVGFTISFWRVKGLEFRKK